MIASVRLLTGVSANVLLKVAQLCEAAFTDRTSVRFDSQVNAGVLRQVRCIGKAFIAGHAAIWLRSCSMDLFAMKKKAML